MSYREIYDRKVYRAADEASQKLAAARRQGLRPAFSRIVGTAAQKHNVKFNDIKDELAARRSETAQRRRLPPRPEPQPEPAPEPRQPEHEQLKLPFEERLDQALKLGPRNPSSRTA